MLEIDHLEIGYRNKKVAGPVNATLQQGELIGLLGPNGTGKSTLLKTVAGLIDRLSGHVYFDKKEISKFAPREKAKVISVVLTEPIGIGNFTVLEVLDLGRYPHKGWWGKTGKTDKEIIEKALENTGIAHLAYRQISRLSDGEKQKVMIARTLAQDTDFILLDEPTSHLDLPSKIEVMSLLKDLAHTWGKAILVSTHDLNLAIQAADKFWLIHKSGAFSQGVNEDLILSGALNDCFELHHRTYDFSTGRITFPGGNGAFVSIKGKGPQYTWTKHAFERLGFVISAEAEISIEAQPGKKWIVTRGDEHKEAETIGQTVDVVDKLIR